MGELIQEHVPSMCCPCLIPPMLQGVTPKLLEHFRDGPYILIMFGFGFGAYLEVLGGDSELDARVVTVWCQE